MTIDFFKHCFSRWCFSGNEVWNHYGVVIHAFGWTCQLTINSPTKIILSEDFTNIYKL